MPDITFRFAVEMPTELELRIIAAILAGFACYQLGSRLPAIWGRLASSMHRSTVRTNLSQGDFAPRINVGPKATVQTGSSASSGTSSGSEATVDPLPTSDDGPAPETVEIARYYVEPGLNGKPVYQFAAKGLDVTAHNASGDHAAFSASGRFLSLLAAGVWQLWDRNDKQFVTIGAQDQAAGRNYRFAWMSEEPNGYAWLDGDGLSFYRVGRSEKLFPTIELPQAIPGPTLLGGETVEPYWRVGLGGGDAIQYLVGSRQISGSEHWFVQPFDSRSGQLHGDGFWMVDATDGFATKAHNGWTGLGGMTFSASSHTAFNYFLDFAGNGFEQIEPNTDGELELPAAPTGVGNWSHQTYDGNLVAYRNVSTSKWDVVEFRGGPSQPPTLLYEIDHEAIQAAGAHANSASSGWTHGDMRDGRVAAFVERFRSNAEGGGSGPDYAIMVLDLATGELTALAEGLYIPRSSFLGVSRPTLSGGDSPAVAWHDLVDDRAVVRMVDL